MSALLALPEGGEWIVILVIVVLVFGANKLPELTRNAARALNEFKKVTAKDAPDETPPEVTPANAAPANAAPANAAPANAAPASAAPASAATADAGTAGARTPEVVADEPAKPQQDSPPA